MIDDWYIRQAGQLRGPYNSAQVRQLVLQGKLDLNDEVSQDQHAWRPLMKEPAVVPNQVRRDPRADAHELQSEQQTHRRQAIASLLLTLVLLAAAFGLAVWQEPPSVPASECSKGPMPGVNWQNCHFDALEANQADLQGAILTNGVLPGAHLQGSDLSKADLRYSNLQGADMSYARLGGARLTGADLRGADLTYAQLNGADLSHADLRGTRLGGAELSGVKLQGALWIDGHRCRGSQPGICGGASNP